MSPDDMVIVPLLVEVEADNHLAELVVMCVRLTVSVLVTGERDRR